jgi:hypothetical protein
VSKAERVEGASSVCALVQEEAFVADRVLREMGVLSDVPLFATASQARHAPRLAAQALLIRWLSCLTPEMHVHYVSSYRRRIRQERRRSVP